MFIKKSRYIFFALGALLSTAVAYPMGVESEENYSLSLHDAADDGDLNRVRDLLEKGADGNERNKLGQTPLFEAVNADINAYDITKFLLDNVPNIDVNASDKFGFTPLHDGVFTKDFKIIDLLLKRGADPSAHNKNGVTPFHVAADLKQPEIIQRMIKEGVDPNIYDNDGNTPLHYAVSAHEKAIKEEVLTFPIEFPQDENGLDPQEEETIKLLLEFKANPGYRNLYYQSPLHFAAAWNTTEAVKLLVDHLQQSNNLAPLNYQDRHILQNDALGSNTALHYAVLNQNLPMVQTLVAAGADINKRNAEGDTPLGLALEPLADMVLTDEQAVIAQELLDQGALVMPNNAGESPLFKGILELDKNYIIKMIDRVNDVTIKDPQTGETLLHIIPESAFSEKRSAIRKVINVLLKKGADINAKDNEGNTPLHTAVFVGDYDIVFELLSHGAERNIQNDDEMTPLDIARQYELVEIEDLLQKEFGA